MKKHLPFIILLLILAVYLGLKTLPENGWGGWCDGGCDAQTLLSIKHWQKDGFLQSKLLFIPIGYSKIVQYLDDPNLRQHARGTTTGGLIGNRLYYTHYPSGYLIPYAIMAKLGIDTVTQRPYFRLLSLVFSFSALILLYYFFNLLTKSSLISFFAILYYSISVMFLDYADSLANQPIDDLFRALILVLSILAIRSLDNPKKYKLYNIAIWLSYFLLSISSYDSTLFVFVWLIGLDILSKQYNWRKWLFFASAPILAFGLQMLQNWWYLGWPDVWLDVLGASMAKAYTSNIFKHLSNIFYPFYLMTGFKEILAGLIILVLIFILWKLKSGYLKNLWPFFIIFILAGSIYPFIFISAGRFSYQGRQMLPFIALLAGIALVFAISAVWYKEKINIFYFNFLIIIMIFLWGGQIVQTVQYIYDWPNHRADDNIMQVAKWMKFSISGDSVVFYLGNRISGDPRTDYYFDRPVLFFLKSDNLVRDFLWLKNHSEYPFSAIIMTDQKKINDNLRQLLQEKVNGIGKTTLIQGEYIFEISP